MGGLEDVSEKTETPELDYWMVEILKEAMSAWAFRKTHWKGGLPGEYARGTDAFRMTPLGQYELINERLNEIRVHYDKMIQKGLDVHAEKSKNVS